MYFFALQLPTWYFEWCICHKGWRIWEYENMHLYSFSVEKEKNMPAWKSTPTCYKHYLVISVKAGKSCFGIFENIHVQIQKYFSWKQTLSKTLKKQFELSLTNFSWFSTFSLQGCKIYCWVCFSFNHHCRSQVISGEDAVAVPIMRSQHLRDWFLNCFGNAIKLFLLFDHSILGV